MVGIQKQTFFLGVESVLKNRLTERDMKTDELCVTPYYLSRITHRIFSVSPKELIDRQIVMEIKSLLTTTELSVKEIVDLYHFESSSYLGRYFRRHVGMTPTEYRDLHNE